MRVLVSDLWSGCSRLGHVDGVADLAGAPLVSNAGEDSFSILPLLLEETDSIRESAVSCAGSGLPSFRMGPWKYIAGVGSGGWSKGGDDGLPVQLYNLETDLGETHNLAAEEPQQLAAMQKAFEAVIARGGSRADAASNNDVPVVRYPK